jgi:hypothetical protein
MSRDLCIMACTFCRDADFQYWAHTQCGECQTADEAKRFVLETCQVKSRNELDTNSEAAQRFHKLIREPFLYWKGMP